MKIADRALIETRAAAVELVHFVIQQGHFAPEEREAIIQNIETMGREFSQSEATRTLAKAVATRLREG